jgi:hypothetical protein
MRREKKPKVCFRRHEIRTKLRSQAKIEPMSTASNKLGVRWTYVALGILLLGGMVVSTGCMAKKQACSAYQEVPCE